MEPIQESVGLLKKISDWLYSHKKKNELLSEILKKYENNQCNSKEIAISLKDIQNKLDSMDSELKNDISVVKNGVQKALRADLIKLHHKLVKKNFATPTEKAFFQDEYKAYHELGSNGLMDFYYEEVIALPEEETIFS